MLLGAASPSSPKPIFLSSLSHSSSKRAAYPLFSPVGRCRPPSSAPPHRRPVAASPPPPAHRLRPVTARPIAEPAVRPSRRPPPSRIRPLRSRWPAAVVVDLAVPARRGPLQRPSPPARPRVCAPPPAPPARPRPSVRAARPRPAFLCSRAPLVARGRPRLFTLPPVAAILIPVRPPLLCFAPRSVCRGLSARFAAAAQPLPCFAAALFCSLLAAATIHSIMSYFCYIHPSPSHASHRPSYAVHIFNVNQPVTLFG